MSADRAREELNRRAEELLDRHGNAILRYAYSYLHNMSDAEEVLQDTMIQFLKGRPPVRRPQPREGLAAAGGGESEQEPPGL